MAVSENLKLLFIHIPKQELNMFFKELNLSPVKLSCLNVSTLVNYKDYYNDGLKKRVYKLYKEDCELFNYKF